MTERPTDPASVVSAATRARTRPLAGQPPRILVVGDVIDDLIVQPLAPITHATDTPSRITPTAGGSAANQAVWFAAAGMQARFAGRVGAADVGRILRVFDLAGVDAHLAADPDRPTGTIVVLVGADGERTMFTDRGANLGLRAADLPDHLLDEVRTLHVSGYSLFDDGVRAAVLDLVGRARSRGLPLSVDPSSTGFLAQVGPRRFLDWLPEVAALFPNLAEGRLLTGADRPNDIVERLLEHAEVVALTLGPDGALVAARGHDPVRVAGQAVEVVDTTGAGDAFCGAFLAAWLTGADLREAGRRGVAAGTCAVGVAGARPTGPPARDRPAPTDPSAPPRAARLGVPTDPSARP